MALRDRIKIILGDITDFGGEAIVNAANTDLVLGEGVAGAIRRRGGPSIQEECDKIGRIPLGEAVLTGAGKLKAKYVIHAAAMGYNQRCTEESLKNAVLNSLKRCKEKGIQSAAMPAIGMGIAGFPIEKGSKILLETIVSFVSENDTPNMVYVVLIDKRSYDLFSRNLEVILKGL